MSNFFAEKIKNADLTKGQQKIANFFLYNQDRICTMSSIKVAQEIGVSDASIIRFSRAIGYEGFSDLKEDLYQSLVKDAFPEMSLIQRMDQSNQQYGETNLAPAFLQLMQQNIANSFALNSQDQYTQAAQMLIRAKQRYVIGLRGCKGLAVQFSRLLGFMLPNVACLRDGECTSINMLQDAQAEDMICMFAFARYYKIDIFYLEMAKEKGVPICLITDNLATPLCKYADLVLLVDTQRMSFFNSTIGAVFLAEYLLTLVSREVNFEDRIRLRDQITSDQRLNPGDRVQTHLT